MTTPFQPTQTCVPFLIPADKPLADCPVFASAIYFNDTYLVFVLNIEHRDAGDQYWSRVVLTSANYPITANTDGSYGFVTGVPAAAVTPLQDWQKGRGGSYAAVSCVRLIDKVYVFIADSAWQTVYVVTVAPNTQPGSFDVGLAATLQLPNAAPGFVPVVRDGAIELLYPDPVLSQIDTIVYDPDSSAVTVGPSINVIGSILAPYSNLSVADVPLGAGALNLAFTDSNNTLLLGQVVGGTITNPQLVNYGTQPAILNVAAGPLIGQADQASAVFFTAWPGQNNPVNYTQAPLIPPATPGAVAVLGGTGTLPHNVHGTFVNEAYLALPGATTPGSLLRLLVYGAVLGGGELMLYLMPTGQLVPQPVVVTDTSQIDKLTPAQTLVYQQSWTLLGIVQGPPPWVDNGPGLVTATTAQIDFSSTSGATATVTYGASVTAGGSGSEGVFDFGGSASYALKKTVARTRKFSVDQTFTLNDSSGSTGLLLVSQPTISNTEYQVYSPDGSTYLHFSLYLIQVTDMVTTMLPYDITNPSAQAYSAGLTPLPKSTVLSSWMAAPPALPQPALSPPALTSIAVAGSSSSFSSTSSHDVTTTNKVKVSANAGAFGFTASVGFSWSNASEASSSFTNGYTATIAPLVTHNPAQPGDVTDVEIQPWILNTTGASAAQLSGLVPTLYTGAMPWVLTWQVLSFSTQGSGA